MNSKSLLVFCIYSLVKLLLRREIQMNGASQSELMRGQMVTKTTALTTPTANISFNLPPGFLNYNYMIKMQVIGHLGKDCIVNTVNGKTVMNFTVAHSEKFKDQQGVQKDKTLWVDCAYWSDRTNVAPYLKKGTQVYVEGTPDIRNYTTADGKHGSALTLRVSGVQLLGGRENQGEGGENRQPYTNQAAAPVSANGGSEINEPMDDLPF